MPNYARDALTQRELQIVDFLVAGWSDQEIADEFTLSVRTVNHHVASVLQKLGVRSRRQLRKLAVENGQELPMTTRNAKQ